MNTTVQEAIFMLTHKNLDHWTDAHDEVAIAALRAQLDHSELSKTCGDCKHFKQPSGRCEHLNMWNMIETDGGYWAFEPPADFGCSLWEAK